MTNFFDRFKSFLSRKKTVGKGIESTSKEQELYEMITNPPQAVKNVFEYLNSEEFNRSKNSMIELNNYYYKNKDTISKEVAEKRTLYQNLVLVEYGFNVSPTLASAFDYGDRAIAKAELNDPIGAIEDFDKAIQLNPDYENAYVWRGEEKYKLGSYEEAVSDYHLALKLNSNNSEIFLNLGNAKLKLGRFDEALNELQKAKALGNEKAKQIINKLSNK